MLHRTVKKNDVNKDKWIGVGGHFEADESPEECLLREVKEETGYTLTSYQYRGIVTFVSGGGVTEYMSPTFAIVNEYTSQKTGDTIYHFDFYRIKKLEEVYDMGYEDYFYGGSICFLEWPELIEDLLPEDAVKVSIEETEDGGRIVKF